jgi:hypothetical protein
MGAAVQKSYQLALDGQLFKQQRTRLLEWHAVAGRRPYEFTAEDAEALAGLVNLCDALADQAHDEHGIDCLLDEETQAA